MPWVLTTTLASPWLAAEKSQCYASISDFSHKFTIFLSEKRVHKSSSLCSVSISSSMSRNQMTSLWMNCYSFCCYRCHQQCNHSAYYLSLPACIPNTASLDSVSATSLIFTPLCHHAISFYAICIYLINTHTHIEGLFYSRLWAKDLANKNLL